MSLSSYFVLRVRCRRIESSRSHGSLSHLLMSFLYVIGHENYRIGRNIMAIMPFKVIQDHRFLLQIESPYVTSY